MTMTPLAFLVVLLGVSTLPDLSVAQTTTGKSSPADVIGTCNAALAMKDIAAAEKAAELVADLRFVFGHNLIEAGSRCLSTVHGEPWSYSDRSGRFLSDRAIAEEVAVQRKEAIAASAAARATEQAERDAEAANQERRQQVLARTYRACRGLLAKDEIAALTNPICNKLFLEVGFGD